MIILSYFLNTNWSLAQLKYLHFIKKGDLFNENLYFQTLNNFSSLGAWQQIDGRTTIKQDSVYLHYFLLPAFRRSYSFDIEGSRNTSQLTSGNLLGLSTSFTYRDKNVAKKSIPSITNLRMGIELNVGNNNNNLTTTSSNTTTVTPATITSTSQRKSTSELSNNNTNCKCLYFFLNCLFNKAL